MSRRSQLAVLLIALGALGAGAVLAGASLIPPELVRGRLDAFALDQSADLLAGDALAGIAARARIAAGAMLIVGLALVVRRRQAAGFLQRLHLNGKELTRRLAASWRTGEKLPALTLLAITAGGAALRAAYLWLPMRYDESYTLLRYASKPLILALSNYSSPNNHLLHTLLVHLASSALGDAPWVVRLPAFLAGVLMAPAAYAFAARLWGRSTGLLTAAFVASASALVEYSVNARGYTLIGLITCLLWWLATYLRDHDDVAAWTLFAVLAALGFYTMPVMLYPFGAISMWLLLLAATGNTALGRGRLLWRLATACAAVVALSGVLYLPALVASGPAALVGNPFVAAQAGEGYLQALWASLPAVAQQWRRDLPLLVRAALAGGALTALIDHLRRKALLAPLLIAAVLLWCIPAVLVQHVVPYRRLWLWLMPMYLAFGSAGIALWVQALSRRLRIPGAAVLPGLSLALALLLGANVARLQSVYYSNETETLRDAPAITAQLRERLQPGDRVFAVAPSDTILEYYFRREGVPVAYLTADVAQAKRVFVVVNEVAGGAGQSLEELLASAGLARNNVLPPLKHRFASVYEVGR